MERDKISSLGQYKNMSAETIPTILIIDDHDELLSILQEIFTINGYQVVAANNAEEAIMNITAVMPDIIICDLMMPGKSGLTLHKQLKDHSDWCNIPFIFLTALSGTEEAQAALESGCDDFLTKPFDPTELVAVVKGKLTLAQHRKKAVSAQMDKYRKRVLQTLSHEFRTPLVSINTGAELLSEQHKKMDEGDVRRLIESIQRGGQRLENLVNDFMILQQIELGQALRVCEVARRPVSLLFLAQTAVEGFRETAFITELGKLELLVPDGVPASSWYAEVYDVQISSVFQRLLSNAQKFGGQNNKITVRLECRENTVSVFIRDRGPGLSEDAKQLACELFSQIDRETQEQQGAGLGLTIAKYLTQINGGTLELHTPTDGIGLEAEIRFPLARAKPKKIYSRD